MFPQTIIRSVFARSADQPLIILLSTCSMVYRGLLHFECPLLWMGSRADGYCIEELDEDMDFHTCQQVDIIIYIKNLNGLLLVRDRKMKTQVDIISGFLGAGKTTLIKKLLAELVSPEKLVIIENEFGEIGIDGSNLKSHGIEVKEITSGCICCTLVGDFGKAIKDVLLQYRPERIVIEPSGVGKLSDIIKACAVSEFTEVLEINMLVAVVDVTKYDIYSANFGEFFEDQIKHAKTVVLSRTQRISQADLQLVVDSIRLLNAKANIITTPWDNLSAERMIAVAEQGVSASLEHELIHDKTTAYPFPMHQNNCTGCVPELSANHAATDLFSVWGVETPKIFKEDILKSLLEGLDKNESLGMILRGKGILQTGTDSWIRFDYVPGEYDFQSTAADYTGRLCIIGKGLDTAKLCRFFGVSAKEGI